MYGTVENSIWNLYKQYNSVNCVSDNQEQSGWIFCGVSRNFDHSTPEIVRKVIDSSLQEYYFANNPLSDDWNHYSTNIAREAAG